MSLPELFPGYSVEKLEEKPGEIGFAYKVIGPKREWFLMRNKVNPHMLFPCPEGRMGNFQIRGCKWFTDRDGTLKPTR